MSLIPLTPLTQLTLPHYRLINFLECDVPSFKQSSNECLNFVLMNVTAGRHDMPHVILVHMDAYMGRLSALATDPNAAVRGAVCRAIVLLLEARYQCIEVGLSLDRVWAGSRMR